MFGIGKHETAHVSELLSAYLDNQLNTKDRRQVETHLHTCVACAEDLRLLRATVQTLHALPSVAVPRSFVLQPVAQSRPAVRLPLLILRLSTAATAAVLLLAIAGDLLSGGVAPAAAPAPQVRSLPAAPTTAAAQNEKSAAEQPALGQRDQTAADTASASPTKAPAPAAPTAASRSITTDVAPAAPMPATAQNAPAAPTATVPAAASALAAPVAVQNTPSGPSSSAAGAPPMLPAPAALQAPVTATVATPPASFSSGGSAIGSSVAGAATPGTTPAAATSTIAATAGPSPTMAAPAAKAASPSAPATSVAPAMATTAQPSHAATIPQSPLHPLELGLAALLAVLIVATVVAGHRQR